MVKCCKFDLSKRCWHDSCDFIDAIGVVGICPLFHNVNGKFVARKVVPERNFSIWDKHRSRKVSDFYG